jgi:hypothetical protein
MASALQVVLPPISSNGITGYQVVVSGGSQNGTFYIIPVADGLSAQSVLNTAATAFGSNLVTQGGGSKTVSLIVVGD